MPSTMASTIVPVPTSSAVTIQQKRNSRIRKLAISQVVLGIVYGILIFIETLLSDRWFVGGMLPVTILQMVPAFLVIIGGSLLLCCKCNCCCKSNCELKGHFILAITCSVLLVIFSIDDIMSAIYFIHYSYYSYGTIFNRYVCPILITILAFVNFGLLMWSAVISGKQSCACCRDDQSNMNYQHQVVYIQQGTPENPQIIMMQPSAQSIQPTQPYFNGMVTIQPPFNGMVPSTAVVLQPGMQPGQGGMQSAQNQVEIQSTSTPNQELNNQDSSPEVEPETHDVTPEGICPPQYEAFQPEQPDMMTTDSDTQLLIPE